MYVGFSAAELLKYPKVETLNTYITESLGYTKIDNNIDGLTHTNVTTDGNFSIIYKQIDGHSSVKNLYIVLNKDADIVFEGVEEEVIFWLLKNKYTELKNTNQFEFNNFPLENFECNGWKMEIVDDKYYLFYNESGEKKIIEKYDNVYTKFSVMKIMKEIKNDK